MAAAPRGMARTRLIARLDIKGPNATLSLAKDDKGDWTFVKPIPTKANKWSVDGLLQSGVPLVDLPAQLAQHEISTLGTLPSYAMYFVDRDMGFPKEIVRFNMQRGIKTVLSQELMAYATRDDNHVLDSILAGRWDAYFRRFAREQFNIPDKLLGLAEDAVVLAASKSVMDVVDL